MLREAGAAEVHFRVSSPPYQWPCFYGMDTGRRSELLAADLSVGEIARLPRASTRSPTSTSTASSPPPARPPTAFCTACLIGRVPGAGARSGRLEARARGSTPDAPTARAPRMTAGEIAGDGDAARAAHLRATPASTSRAGEKAVELHQGPRALDVPARGRRRHRRVRRAVRASTTAASATRCSCRRPTASARSRSIARLTGRYDTIGIDLVAMSVDDIAVQGAEPLFFLDYISIGKLVPEMVDDDRRGRRATAAAQAGCALLGGEMSEHPDTHGAGRVRPRRLRGRRRRARPRSCPPGVRPGDRDRRPRQPRAALQRLLARPPRAARPRRPTARRPGVDGRAPLARRGAARARA